MDDVAMHVGQSTIDAIVTNGESRVVDAEQVQDGGMNIVDLSGVAAVERLIAPFVRGTVADTTANAGSAEPVGEHPWIVITSFAALS